MSLTADKPDRPVSAKRGPTQRSTLQLWPAHPSAGSPPAPAESGAGQNRPAVVPASSGPPVHAPAQPAVGSRPVSPVGRPGRRDGQPPRCPGLSAGHTRPESAGTCRGSCPDELCAKVSRRSRSACAMASPASSLRSGLRGQARQRAHGTQEVSKLNIGVIGRISSQVQSKQGFIQAFAAAAQQEQNIGLSTR